MPAYYCRIYQNTQMRLAPKTPPKLTTTKSRDREGKSPGFLSHVNSWRCSIYACVGAFCFNYLVVTSRCFYVSHKTQEKKNITFFPLGVEWMPTLCCGQFVLGSADADIFVHSLTSIPVDLSISFQEYAEICEPWSRLFNGAVSKTHIRVSAKMTNWRIHDNSQWFDILNVSYQIVLHCMVLCGIISSYPSLWYHIIFYHIRSYCTVYYSMICCHMTSHHISFCYMVMCLIVRHLTVSHYIISYCIISCEGSVADRCAKLASEIFFFFYSKILWIEDHLTGFHEWDNTAHVLCLYMSPLHCKLFVFVLCPIPAPFSNSFTSH